MARTASFPLHDQISGGRLSQSLKTWRREDPKVSYETIAYRLRNELGIVVSTATVRRWCLDHDLEPPQVKAG